MADRYPQLANQNLTGSGYSQIPLVHAKPALDGGFDVVTNNTLKTIRRRYSFCGLMASALTNGVNNVPCGGFEASLPLPGNGSIALDQSLPFKKIWLVVCLTNQATTGAATNVAEVLYQLKFLRQSEELTRLQYYNFIGGGSVPLVFNYPTGASSVVPGPLTQPPSDFSHTWSATGTSQLSSSANSTEDCIVIPFNTSALVGGAVTNYYIQDAVVRPARIVCGGERLLIEAKQYVNNGGLGAGQWFANFPAHLIIQESNFPY